MKRKERRKRYCQTWLEKKKKHIPLTNFKLFFLPFQSHKSLQPEIRKSIDFHSCFFPFIVERERKTEADTDTGCCWKKCIFSFLMRREQRVEEKMCRRHRVDSKFEAEKIRRQSLWFFSRDKNRLLMGRKERSYFSRTCHTYDRRGSNCFYSSLQKTQAAFSLL